MDQTLVLLITVVAVIVAAAVFLLATSRRRDAKRALAQTADDDQRQPVTVGAPSATGRELERSVALQRRGQIVLPGTAPPAPAPAPPDEETLGVTRRQVLNRGIVTAMLLGISGFGAAMLAMLWPSLSGGFGSKIRAGKEEEIRSEIADTEEPFYLAEGRFYVNPYPPNDVAKAKSVTAYSAVLPGMEQGWVALYQKCVHLGCRVPWCKTSQWFECPCHGSQYNRVGEKKGGPAPRGLDRFVLSVEGGNIVVDTSQVIQGPPIGTNTTGQESAGPHCVGAAGGH
jgi:cytochrome b6-f complex iron-sulfur subunit